MKINRIALGLAGLGIAAAGSLGIAFQNAQPEALVAQNEEEGKSGGKYENPLIQAMADMLDEVKGDLEDGDHQAALDSLNEGDKILTRVKKENKAALKKLHQGSKGATSSVGLGSESNKAKPPAKKPVEKKVPPPADTPAPRN